jgi:hypothetical protein
MPEANIAAITAPIEVPTKLVGAMPPASSACMTPICAAALAPPPLRTSTTLPVLTPASSRP